MMTQVQTAQQPPQSGVTAELYAQVEDYLSRTEVQESQPTKKKRKVIKKKSAKTTESKQEGISAGQLEVKINGKTVRASAYEIVSRMVEAEMGSTFQPEALKAQAVAAYTYVRFHNQAGVIPIVAAKDTPCAQVKQAVQEVLGEAVYYDGKIINATYGASNAGQSMDAEHVWGNALPYLVSVDSPGDTTLRAYGATKTFSEQEIAELISEELGRENPGGVRGAMLRCVAYALFFGLASGLVLWLLAEPVGFLCIGDARTVRSLRISALGMPCISLCAAFSGYFTACGRVWKPTFIHFAEQLAGIALVAYFLRAVPDGEIEQSCAAVTFGRLLADVLSTALMLIFYLADRRSYYGAETNNSHLTGRMLKIALPLAASAYARSALNTMQHLLVPRGLRAAGFSADRALAGYGIIQGMVLPILGFPACLMSAMAELIVPELTEAQVQRDNAGIARAIRSLLKMSLLFSGGAALFMFVFSDKLGLVIYSSAEAG